MKQDVENIDYVSCRICGKRSTKITSVHLKFHGMSLVDYKSKFPKNKTISEKLRMKIVESNKTFWSSAKGKNMSVIIIMDREKRGWKEKHQEGIVNLINSSKNKERSKKIGNALRGKARPLSVGIAVSNAQKGRKHSEKENIKRSKSLKKFYTTEEGKISIEKVHAQTRGRKYPEISEKLKIFYQTKEGKECIDRLIKSRTGRKHSIESIKKMQVKAMAAREKDGYWENLQKGLKLRPNKFEQKVVKLFPSSYQYTGDFNPNGMFKFLDGRNKNADFTKFPERTKVIECFGEYWHDIRLNDITREEHERDIVGNYKDIGVDCLVIWEGEMTEINKVKEKILLFLDVEDIKELKHKKLI